eukprot:TRINITY_DN7608_c0_g1_i1.p1 TRINITY_DN7608_c0_g1~~TRINITY_DN7608_c0_g1_i1.p1  ORF type:complete len:436 (+),score=77.38 TRINITY_DN7608_c0_g1_i1:87-1394(+)
MFKKLLSFLKVNTEATKDEKFNVFLDFLYTAHVEEPDGLGKSWIKLFEKCNAPEEDRDDITSDCILVVQQPTNSYDCINFQQDVKSNNKNEQEGKEETKYKLNYNLKAVEGIDIKINKGKEFITKRYNLHLLVLRLHFPHLFEMFTRKSKIKPKKLNLEENEILDNGILEFKDIVEDKPTCFITCDIIIFEQILRFIYGRQVVIDNYTALLLLYYSDIFEVKYINESCLEYINLYLETDDVCFNTLSNFCQKKRNISIDKFDCNTQFTFDVETLNATDLKLVTPNHIQSINNNKHASHSALGVELERGVHKWKLIVNPKAWMAFGVIESTKQKLVDGNLIFQTIHGWNSSGYYFMGSAENLKSSKDFDISNQVDIELYLKLDCKNKKLFLRIPDLHDKTFFVDIVLPCRPIVCLYYIDSYCKLETKNIKWDRSWN